MADPSTQSAFIARWLPLAVIVAAGYLLFITFRPFFTALAWAGLLAYGLNPVYQVVLRWLRGSRNLASLLMCIAVTVGVIFPLVYVAVLIGDEITRSYESIFLLVRETGGSLGGWQSHPLAAYVLSKLHAYEELTGMNLRAVLIDNLAQLGGFAVQRLTRIATNTLMGLLQFAFVVLAMFYLFRDGHLLIAWLRDILPFPPERQDLVVRRIHQVITGAVFGNTVIALVEGLAGGLAFWAVGLPAPTLWGVVMAVLAFLPMLGASLVWGPAALYLAVQGAYPRVAILVAVGIVIAFLDYITRTIVIGERSQLHTLVVFFSVLGGLQVFGLIGVFLGPLIAALGLVLLERDQPPRVVQSGTA